MCVCVLSLWCWFTHDVMEKRPLNGCCSLLLLLLLRVQFAAFDRYKLVKFTLPPTYEMSDINKQNRIANKSTIVQTDGAKVSHCLQHKTGELRDILPDQCSDKTKPNKVKYTSICIVHCRNTVKVSSVRTKRTSTLTQKTHIKY